MGPIIRYIESTARSILSIKRHYCDWINLPTDIQTSIRSNMEWTPRSMGHRYRDWSNLPTDLLEFISTKLSLSDFLSVKGACSSWRVCSSWHGATKRIDIPLLVFLSKWQSIKSKIDAKVLFLGINKGRPYERKETTSSLKHRDIHCDDHKVVGFHPDGWLILKDKEGHYFLLELLTHVRIDLPKLIKYNTSQDNYTDKVILSDNPNCRQDFIVIMLYREEQKQKLAFWRNGDRRWSRLLLSDDDGQQYSDIIWCDDSLYAVKTYGSLLVEVWDFNRNGTSSDFCKIKSRISRFNPVLSDKWGFAWKQLVASSTGELLLVSLSLVTTKWEVFKVELSKERCSELRTLNGQALVMVGMDPLGWFNNNSFCVSSVDVEKNGYRANSIYFAKVVRPNNGTFDMKIQLSNYSLGDEEVEELWETSIPFGVDVNLQALGLCSLNIKSCSSALQPMV